MLKEWQKKYKTVDKKDNWLSYGLFVEMYYIA